MTTSWLAFTVRKQSPSRDSWANRAALISILLGLSRTPTEAVRPWIRG